MELQLLLDAEAGLPAWAIRATLPLLMKLEPLGLLG